MDLKPEFDRVLVGTTIHRDSIPIYLLLHTMSSDYLGNSDEQIEPKENILSTLVLKIGEVIEDGDGDTLILRQDLFLDFTSELDPELGLIYWANARGLSPHINGSGRSIEDAFISFCNHTTNWFYTIGKASESREKHTRMLREDLLNWFAETGA